MQHDPKKYLHDIAIAAGKIKRFVEGLDLDSYMNDDLITSAVHMQFIIIGESMIELRKEYPEEFSDFTDGSKIIGFRHIVAHSYDKIIDDIVWDVITNKIDTLISEAERLID